MLSAIKENSQEVLDAQERELNSLKENNVFNWVEDHGQVSVSCKWVFTVKQMENGSKMLKARLVTQGPEEKCMNERTDFPTCSWQAFRMVFISAFLQGNDIESKAFVWPSWEMMEEGKIWKLQRCIYGLNDALRYW